MSICVHVLSGLWLSLSEFVYISSVLHLCLYMFWFAFSVAQHAATGHPARGREAVMEIVFVMVDSKIMVDGEIMVDMVEMVDVNGDSGCDGDCK